MQAEGGDASDFTQQCSLFPEGSGGDVRSDGLNVVQFGGNDLRVALELAQSENAAGAEAEIQDAVAASIQNIGRLNAAGAKTLLVATGQDLDRTPVLAAAWHRS